LVLLVGLAVRLAWVAAGTGDNPVSERNEILAENLRAGRGFSHQTEPPWQPTAFGAPGYPVFLAALYALRWTTPQAVHIVQGVLGALTSCLVYCLGCTFSSRWAALTSSLWHALHPALACAATVSQGDTLIALLTCCLCWLLLQPDGRAPWTRSVTAGLLAGLLLLCGSEWLVVVPLMALAMLIRSGPRAPGSIRAGVFLMVAGLVAVPWVARNYQVAGLVAVVIYPDTPPTATPTGACEQLPAHHRAARWLAVGSCLVPYTESSLTQLLIDRQFGAALWRIVQLAVVGFAPWILAVLGLAALRRRALELWPLWLVPVGFCVHDCLSRCPYDSGLAVQVVALSLAAGGVQYLIAGRTGAASVRQGRRAVLRGLAGSALALLAAAGTVGWQNKWFLRRALLRLGLVRPPANLLRNAAFLQCTNPGIPDYWATPGAAARIQGGGPFVQVVREGPLPGVYTLRVHHPDAGQRIHLESYNAAYDIRQPQPSALTFSVYLKSDREPCRVVLGVNDQEQEVAVGLDWQRLAVSVAPGQPAAIADALVVRVHPLQPGTILVAAPQLEAGRGATEFCPALMDDYPVPALPWPAEEHLSLVAPPDATEPLVNLEPRPATVRIDRVRRQLLVEAEPYPVFGIALGDRLQQGSDWQMRDIAAHGLNTVCLMLPGAVGRVQRAAALRHVQRELDAASRHGLRAVLFLAHDRASTFAEIVRATLEQMAALQGHEALLCWILLDEPSRWWVHPPRRRLEHLPELYALAKRQDPHHPVFINEERWEGTPGGRALLSATDLGSLDCYPIGHYCNAPAQIAALARAANADCRRVRKPFAFWLQLSGGHGTEPREPAVGELTIMTYLALVYDARLFFYWLYKPMNLALWQRLPDLIQEVRRWLSLVSRDGAAPVAVGTSRGRLHYAVWNVGQRSVVLACNAAAESVAGTVPLGEVLGRGTAGVRTWYEPTAVRVTEGGLIVTLGPHERQVFELG
jgi:hypothetical protein